MIFLYSNQPVIKYSGQYFSRMKNFIDFLSLLSQSIDASRLIVPCKEVIEIDIQNYVSVKLPSDVVEVSWYEGHKQALFRTFTNAKKIRKATQNALNKDDVVVIAGPGPNSMLFLLSWILPKSVLFAFFIRGDTAKTVENMYRGHLIGPAATALVKLFQHRIYSLMRQRRAITFTYGTKLKAMYGVHGKTTLIAPLIDSADISPKTSTDVTNSTKHVFRVLFVGRLSPEKGIQDLVNACQMAAEAGEPFELTIIGHGPLTDSLIQQIKSNDLGRWVSFVGFVPHGESLMAYFDNHDLLCLPSYTEGVPRVVIEAFARGLYVAATPVGSIPDLFSEHVRLIDRNSPESILESINWCRANREAIKKTTMGLPVVAQKYTLEHHLKIVKQQLDELVTTGL